VKFDTTNVVSASLSSSATTYLNNAITIVEGILADTFKVINTREPIFVPVEATTLTNSKYIIGTKGTVVPNNIVGTNQNIPAGAFTNYDLVIYVESFSTSTGSFSSEAIAQSVVNYRPVVGVINVAYNKITVGT